MAVRTTQQLPLHSLLALVHSPGKKKMKMLLTGLGRSALEETVPEAGNNK